MAAHAEGVGRAAGAVGGDAQGAQHGRDADGVAVYAGGWAHVPSDPDSLPWAAPLSPKTAVQQQAAAHGAAAGIALPPTSLTFADVG